jgi:GNAT superfamily N-acetyltransferase
MQPTPTVPPSAPIIIAPPLLAELGEQHKFLILKHLLALPEHDRRLRFGTPAGDAAIERYVGSIDFDRDVVLGLVDEAGHLRGFGHLVLHAATPELGISIDPAARGGGLGSLLLARACGHVRGAGKEHLVMHYLPENIALARLAARAGMRLDVVEGEGRALLTLPPLDADDAPSRLAGEMAQAVDLAMRLAVHDRDAANDEFTSA